MEKLPLEARFKVLTREDLIAYAKQKQIILEPNQLAALPQDDPRHKMTEADHLAKAACDRMFELSVLARRAKKEKLQKLEEEAKLQQLSNIDSLYDQDSLDAILALIDYPSTKSEALAMAKYNMGLSCVLDVRQQSKEDLSEEEQAAVGQQEQYDGSDDANFQKTEERLKQLKEARDASMKNSPLRHMYITQLDFFNLPQFSTQLNQNGEEIQVRKEADQVFLAHLIQKMEHFGSLLIKYRKFREKVPLVPLMPDKYAMHQIEQLQQESHDYHAWLQEGEHVFANLNSSQKSDPAQQQDEQQRRHEFEQEKAVRVQEEQERQQRIVELRKSLKVSVDDARDYSTFNLNTYNTDFLKNHESKNCISAIMSSMITQIAKGDLAYTSLQTHEDESTEPDTIDDIFDDFEKELHYDLQLEERPQSPEQADAAGWQSGLARQRKKGTQAFMSQNTIIGEVEYHEEEDKSKQPLFKLPREVTSSQEDKAEDVCLREKEVLQSLVLPGFNRHLMPQVPSKSQRVRDAEKPALYPFCTLPIEDSERALIKKAFQELLRSNFIDEGQTGDAKHHKYKTFERNFEQHMSPEILRQVLAEALLKEPDVATLYYPRNDSLLVTLYNKIKDIQRSEDGVHGEREWKAAYRVMPDFENWVNFFSQELIMPLTHNNKSSTATLPRYQLDEEMVPDQMIDIDDTKIQNLSEKCQMFYPLDGSIMKVDTYTVGGQTHQKSVVYKDNLTFGFRQCQAQTEVPEEEKEYGLYSIQKSGNIEFWMNFENDTKVLCEMAKYQKNPQRMIRIDPPKPTPEEIAAREEAFKQAQALAAKNKGKGAQPVVIEEYKEPEPTWEPEPLDFLDTVFTDQFLQFNNDIAQVTTTLANGLIVQHMADGSIVQLFEDAIFDKSIEEKDRVILSNSGVVVRHFRNRDAEVLFPHGEFAYFNKKEMMWTVTNNKGRRRATKSGVTWDLESIPSATETDAVSNAKMTIREDKVMTIQFKDGSLYCQHKDGTLFKTSSDGNEIRIEKEGYAPIVCKKGLSQSNSDSFKTEERALGYVMYTYLPDGTIVETFYDRLLHGIGIRHLFKRPDFTIVSFDSYGQIDIISSNARGAMNENYGRKLMSQDDDYCRALYQQRASLNYFGCYHAFIGNQNEFSEPTLFTVDEKYERFYTITLNLELDRKQNCYYDAGIPGQDAIMSYRSEFKIDVQTDHPDIENTGGYKNPINKHFIFPRLFVINSDGTGYELLTKEQLDYYFRIAKNREDSIKQRRHVMIGTTLAKTHYFVTKVKNMSDFDQENQELKLLEFPQNSQYALFHLKNKAPKPDPNESRTVPSQYLFRQIFEFQDFEAFKQEAFYDDFDRYKQWKMSQVRYDSEFGIVWIPVKDQVIDYKKIENDEYFSRRIITRILKERRNQRPKFDPDHFKRDFMKSLDKDQEINNFYKRSSTYHLGSDPVLNQSLEQSQQQLILDKQAQLQQMQENANQEKIKNIKKKQKAQINFQIEEIRKMVNTPTFLPNYFGSKDGQLFVKNNPQKPPSQEMITRMSQRINRSQHGSDKGHSQYEGNQSQREGASGQIEGGDEKESPIVALEPEDHYKNASNYMGTKRNTKGEAQNNQPSLYLQEKMFLKQREQEQILKSEEYHVVKTKDFNVVGRLRQDKPFVKAIQKSQAQSELNEKFITTECIADRRVKIASMAARQYINAPSIEDVRKQGQHQMILSAINKKQTFAELINQANSMVTSVLHDPLKRSVNIMPSQLKYGILQAGAGAHEMVLTIKNEDSLAQRVTIKPMTDKRIKFQQIETGPIAPGMIRKISVYVQSDDECTLKDQLQILTKTEVYKIPIEAQFLSSDNYQKEYQEQRALSGRGLANSRVRNKLNDSIQMGRMSAKAGERQNTSADRNEDQDGMNKQPNWIETTNSDSRLPQIPNASSRPFEVDPKKNLKDLLRK